MVYQDPETGKVYVFLTNNFRLAAKTILPNPSLITELPKTA
jgi:hypothetical protein